MAVADDGFEVLIEPTEDVEEPTSTPPPEKNKVRKLCACGCGEEVTGNRALKRGHTIGTGITNQWAPEDLIVLQTAVCAFLMAVTAFIENKRHVPRMELEEAQAIGNPIGRIAARHMRWKHIKPGDAADVASITVALGAYVMRCLSSEKKESQTIATNGHIADSPISGQNLSQYSYRPPEQNFEQENGRAA